MTLSVVIGGARGIGRAIAVELGRTDPSGRVLVADSDGAGAEQVAQELLAAGVDAVARAVDIRDAAALKALVADSSEATRVAVAAGIFRSSPALETPMSELEEVLAVNTIGCFHVAQLYAAKMVEQGQGGSIVAVASIAARMPRMRQAAYAASKAAIRQALRVLAMEVVGHGVRINTVSPGPTDTEMMRELASDHASISDLSKGDLAVMRPRIPSGRVAEAADVAAAAVFLLGAGSAHIALADVVVDGGELLGM